MWWIANWLKGLLSGKGPTQIQAGKGNQATSSTTSGHNSPILTAGRDVNFNVPITPTTDPDEELLGDLEEVMPDFLRDLRANLVEHPLTRFIITTPTESFEPMFGQDWFRFSKEKYSSITNYMGILENHRLVEEKQAGWIYRLSERFVKLIRKR